MQRKYFHVEKESILNLKMVMLGEGKSSSQGIPSIFSLQVSSKLSRLAITSCCHVANYVNIILAQSGKKS